MFGRTRIETLWNVPTWSVPGRAIRERGEICLGRLELRGQARRVAQHALAGSGRHDRAAAARSLQQPHAGGALQCGDLQADRRLGVAELLRGACERSGRRDRVEGREVADLDAEQSMRLFHHFGLKL